MLIFFCIQPSLPPGKLNIIINGLFMSKLTYGITVWSKIWGLPGVLDEEVRKSTAITKEDFRRIQVLQNAVMRIKTGLDREASLSTMCQQSGYLSVHQMGAYHTACQVFKVYKDHTPSYHYNRLFGRLTNEQQIRSITSLLPSLLLSHYK